MAKMKRFQETRGTVTAATEQALRVTIIIPTYNEAGNIKRVISQCLDVVGKRFDRLEILVVDDDSPDGTADIARATYKDDDRIQVLCRKKNRGLAQAVGKGLKKASYQYCVIIDADLQHPPEKLPELIETLKNDTQIVIGSRYIENGGVKNWSIYRKGVSWVGTLLTRIALSSLRDIADPLSGFFAVKRSVVEDVELDPRGYKILLEILVKGDYDRIAEVPYVFHERQQGESKLTYDEYIRFIEHLLLLFPHKRDAPDTIVIPDRNRIQHEPDGAVERGH